ncbi:MAG: hemolysin III family protein [Chloroflexi bacterium]|nr:hemolysin III family protein [Chloroflexota bacterium]
MSRFLKEPVNGLTHFATALVCVPGAVVLWQSGEGNLPRQISLLIFGLSLILMFAASAAYHLLDVSPRRVLWLRRLDHVAIFVLIAGTYTPVTFNALSGGWRSGMLIAIWTIAAAGIAFKLLYVNVHRAISAGLYLAMGWLAMIAAGQIYRALPPGGILWLLIGGLFYTLGALIYATKWLDFFPGVFGFHEVWHLFVMAGAASHYWLVLRYVAPLAPL